MSRKKYVVYNLRETYHELGHYEFKIVLDPRYFKNGHMSRLTCIDSDGKPMNFNAENWGRKINCSFLIDRNVPDGVSVVNMKLSDGEGNEHNGTLSFWVIKP